MFDQSLDLVAMRLRDTSPRAQKTGRRITSVRPVNSFNNGGAAEKEQADYQKIDATIVVRPTKAKYTIFGAAILVTTDENLAFRQKES
jgi:hypothetical protein